MKAKDLRERTAEDLRELEKSLAKDVFQARFKNFTNRLDDTSSIGKTRRDLARVKTLLHEQALVAATKSGAEAAPRGDAAPKKSAKPARAAKAAAPKTAKKSKKEEAK